MKRPVNKILLIANMLKKDSERLVQDIKNYMQSREIEVVPCCFKGKPSEPSLDNYDLAFSLGGDGTVLYSARLLADLSVPIIPVNIGHFGFITEIAKDEWKSVFEKYSEGLLDVKEHVMLDVSIIRDNKVIEKNIGLNDAVINAAGTSKIVKLKVNIMGTELGSYRADGVIISTPTGSTAYSVAAGGPILDPEMDAMIINPICPFTLSNRPIVVDSSKVIEVMVEENQKAELILTVDGQLSYSLLPGDVIHFKGHEKKAVIVQTDQRNFFDVLRAKLKWAGGPDA